MTEARVVLVLGSGPSAPEAAGWSKELFDRIVVINNAWQIRPDWDDLIFPEDFPEERRPEKLGAGQRTIEADAFIPAQNAFGGVVYAGGTMAFTAGYWVLDALRPAVMAFMACDMVYPARGRTHFYGQGAADPLREDPTLQDLGAKAARLGLLAAGQGCSCVNLSDGESILPFPRRKPGDLREIMSPMPPGPEVAAVLEVERALGCHVPSGRYWEAPDLLDAQELAKIDAGWRRAWMMRPARPGAV